jgi:hypothetical protein
VVLTALACEPPTVGMVGRAPRQLITDVACSEANCAANQKVFGPKDGIYGLSRNGGYSSVIRMNA